MLASRVCHPSSLLHQGMLHPGSLRACCMYEHHPSCPKAVGDFEHAALTPPALATALLVTGLYPRLCPLRHCVLLSQAFLQQGNRLVSSSKDSFVKVWDLDTQHCSQTVVGFRGEVWSLDIDPSETRVATASSDAEIRVFAVVQPEETAAAAASHELLQPMGMCTPCHLRHQQRQPAKIDVRD